MQGDAGNNPYYNNFGSEKTLCPIDQKCLDGSFNYLCAKDPLAHASHCRRLIPVEATFQSIEKMVNVHNGIRNKLAYDRRLANINLVYWNVHLQHMAERYLRLCRPQRDTCLIVGTGRARVGHNHLFVPRRSLALLEEWEGRAVMNWFRELGDEKVALEDLDTEGKAHQNIRQLIMPTTEFIGCSAAFMFNGYLIVCYYYPALVGPLELTYLKQGETCVCPKSRLMCSLLFTSLCGIDLNIYSDTANLLPTKWILFIYVWCYLSIC